MKIVALPGKEFDSGQPNLRYRLLPQRPKKT